MSNKCQPLMDAAGRGDVSALSLREDIATARLQPCKISCIRGPGQSVPGRRPHPGIHWPGGGAGRWGGAGGRWGWTATAPATCPRPFSLLLVGLLLLSLPPGAFWLLTAILRHSSNSTSQAALFLHTTSHNRVLWTSP